MEGRNISCPARWKAHFREIKARTSENSLGKFCAEDYELQRSLKVSHAQVPGNPVRFRGGCATVTGYKLPKPLTNVGKAEVRLSPKVRIPIWTCSSPLRKMKVFRGNFSVKEKDEASLLKLSFRRI